MYERVTARSRSGFTLIELIIVVSIIAIVVAMGLPKLMAARLAANESSAIATLRALASAEASFFSASNTQDFCASAPRVCRTLSSR